MLEEIRTKKLDASDSKAEDDGAEPGDEPENTEVDTDYELTAYSNTKIEYEYIIHLIQNIITPNEGAADITPEERQKKEDEVKQYLKELRRENPKAANIMSDLLYDVQLDE